MIQEVFNFYKPCKLLQPYVRYYWVFSSSVTMNGIVNLVLHLLEKEFRCRQI